MFSKIFGLFLLSFFFVSLVSGKDMIDEVLRRLCTAEFAPAIENFDEVCDGVE